MRPLNTLLCCLLCACSSQVFAQNWIPVVEGDVYLYDLVGDSTYTSFSSDLNDNTYADASIWIDSTQSSNTEVAHLNKIIRFCDTCSYSLGYYFHYLRNQAQFLGHKMEDMGAGVYQFTTDDTIVIATQAAVGDTWTVFPNAGITAEVTAINQSQIFGNIDQTKLIVLSNNDTIILSENHGIIRFPNILEDTYYELSGIQSRDLGATLPMFDDIYDFDIGDVYQYGFGSSYYNSGSNGDIKITVLDRQDAANSITYQIRKITRSNIFNIGPIDTIVTIDTLYHVFYSGDVVEHYPRDLFISPVDELVSWSANYGAGSSPGSLCTMYHGKNEEGEWIKWMGTAAEPSRPISSHFDPSFIAPYVNDPNVLIATWTDAFYRTWQEGLGEIRYSFNTGTYSESRELRGYIQDGVTTGTITPDSILAPMLIFTDTTVELVELNDVLLYPNPTVNELNFEIRTAAPHRELELIVYDITGRACKKWTFQNIIAGTIQVGDLPKGVYVLNFKSEDGVYSKKFIK